MGKDIIERVERRGRKPKPSVSFYMRCSTYGDIKIMFSYGGQKYTGGSTYLTLFREEFDLLNPNGEPKNAKKKDNPKLINGIYVHELLRIIRRSVEERVESDLKQGRELSEEYLKGLMSEACSKMFEQLGMWSSNIEWNIRANKASKQGMSGDFCLLDDVKLISDDEQ